MHRVTCLVLGVVAAFAAGNPAAAKSVKYSRLKPSDFAAFVMNWTPQTEPRCAIMQSAADWSAVMHPAPVMGSRKPTAPQPGFWSGKAVLLVARVVDATRGNVFVAVSLQRSGDTLDLSYTFAPPAAASSTMKSYLAVAVRKPLPKEVHFVEGGQRICTVATGN